MTYYFLLEGEDPEHVIYDANTLGHSTKKTFYPERGLQRLMKISDQLPELLEKITIHSDGNKTYTINEFLKIISKLIIIQH